MDTTAQPLPPFSTGPDAEGSCMDPFPLCRVRKGAPDKLGNVIRDILWVGADYIVYRSDKGVYVHFDDSPEREEAQRMAFREIAPELCELRFFIGQMHKRRRPWLTWWRGRRQTGFDEELYDHNIAQSLMLVMEGDTARAKAIVKAALGMAVRRSTNDNTIAYLVACGVAAGVWVFFCGFVLRYGSLQGLRSACCIASIFGTLGAAFSIITRVQSFEMKPCQQSNMNYWMSVIRICIGMIGGVMLFLLAGTMLSGTILSAPVVAKAAQGTWKVAAVIGFLGGFSERLIQSLLQRTTNAIAPAPGTPVQEARREHPSEAPAA